MTVKTRATITSEINANINDNNTGDITPADVRQRLLDLVDSLAVLGEDLGLGTTVAAAATLTLGTGQVFVISGNTGITDIDFSNAWDGRWAVLLFTGTPTVTHNATTLKLPGGANLVMAAGDRLELVQESGDNINVLSHVKAAGLDGADIKTGTVPDARIAATLTGKRITKRVLSTASSATPAVNTNLYDAVSITALAAAITSMTSGLTGTPTDFQQLTYRIKDNGTARAIAWGASFEAKGMPLPVTTVINKVLTVGFMYDTVAAKWGCVSVAQEV